MKVLVFDTETTGLPTERNPSIMETTSWPHVLQLSYILYDSETKRIIEMQDNLIKIPTGVEITPGSEAIHHITRLMCEDRGIDIRDALNKFNKTLDKADVIVGHNISFDKRLIMVECIRTNIRQRFTVNGAKIAEYCTMKRSSELCQIERTNSTTGETYFKYPTLSELHNKLFGFKPNGAHNAFADILICLRCYTTIVEEYDFVDDMIVDNYHELKNLYLQYTF